MNPPVAVAAAVAGAAVPTARSARSAKDYLALAIATCGVGYLPLAPGTWGSLVGIAIYLLVQSYALKIVNDLFAADSFARFLPLPILVAFELVLISIIILIGIWAASQTEQLSGKKDPGKVVIDEVAGQMIALLPLVPGADPGWISILIAFVLFRIFDIVKPYPARRLERLESGLGIMSDDIVAGAYAAVGTAVLAAIIFMLRV